MDHSESRLVGRETESSVRGARSTHSMPWVLAGTSAILAEAASERYWLELPGEVLAGAASWRCWLELYRDPSCSMEKRQRAGWRQVD